MSDTTTVSATNKTRFLLVAVLVVGAFFGAYQFAAARSGVQAGYALQGDIGGAAPAVNDPNAAGGAACACCGTGAPTTDGVSGDKVEGAAVVEGDVQKIEIDLSSGIYNPNVIKLKAGVPTEITFGQGAGCTAQVMSKDLNFFEDLTTGPKTVKIASLEPGEYAFSCGMEMVFGKIVVE